MKRILFVALIYVLSSALSALAGDAEFGVYEIETTNGTIQLPFKKDDVVALQKNYSEVLTALEACVSFQGGWHDLPTGRDINVSIKARNNACRVTIEMEGVRQFTCLYTAKQSAALSGAMSPYRTGDRLPTLYVEPIQSLLYQRACDVTLLN